MSGSAAYVNGQVRKGKGQKKLTDAEVEELRRLLKVKPEDIGPQRKYAKPKSSAGSNIPEDVKEFLEALPNRD